MSDERPLAAAVHRLTNVVTRVERGEVVTALTLTFNVFLLLTAYYVVKPVREGLILSLQSGAEYKSYASAAIALLLVALVPLYGRVAGLVSRNRLIVGVTLFFASHLVGFYWASRSPELVAWLGIPFYLWVGVFNMMIVAQFWAFANDIYNEEQGKRLFALVGVGASLGAVFGSSISAVLLRVVGVFQLLLVSAVLLVLSAAITQWVHQREVARGPVASPRVAASEPSQAASAPSRGGNGLAMVMRSGYLRYIALFTLVFTFVNTNGEYLLGVFISNAAVAAESTGALGDQTLSAHIGQRYGEFYFYVNVLGVLLQVFVVSRLVRVGGVGLALVVVPIVAVGGWAITVAAPILAVVWVSKTLENAGDYSVNNTVRQMLWLPTTSAEKYNAKQAIDTIFVRLGDVSSALLVFAFAQWAVLPARGFAAVNTVAAVAWLWIALRLRKHNAQAGAAMSSTTPPEREAGE